MRRNPITEVFAVFCAPNKTVLSGHEHLNQTTESGSHTSSASQLANTIVLSGFQPCSSRTPKPRMTSCNDTVPLVGSAAPMTHASMQNVSNGLCALQALLIVTVTMISNHDNFIGDMTWDRRHNIVYFCDFCVNCQDNKQNCVQPVGPTWTNRD